MPFGVSEGIQVAGLLGSLFGGASGPQISDEQRRLYNFLLRIARNRLRYAQGVPGSDPQEQAAMAQALAVSNQQAGAGREQLLAAMGVGRPGSENAADALSNMESARTAQNAGVSMQAMLGFLANRQNAYGQAAGVAQGATGLAQGFARPGSPGVDYSGLLQQLGYQMGQRQRSAAPAPPPTGTAITMSPSFGQSLPNFQPYNRGGGYFNPRDAFDYDRGGSYFR